MKLCVLRASVVKPSLQSMEDVLYHRGTEGTEFHRENSMKQYLIILFICLVASSYSQKSLNVLDWKTEYSLNTYLVQQMHAQYDARRTALAKALSSPVQMKAYMAAARKKYLSLLGELPARTPLNAVITGIIQEDSYTIEKIAYESFPSHHVTANLYIPKGKGPFPAVLLFCGHEDVSKATESYQQTAILFARNGYVVLVIDPISQSERYQLTDNTGKPLTRGGTSEHTLLNEASNLLGGSTPADELWDNIRSLDYLVTRSEVDTARIGCLGNSGGGMQTVYFAGYDTRIKVIAPCSYLATRERTIEMTGPADGCAQIPGEGAAQLELADYILMAAPKPTLILAGRYDFIDYRGTEEAYRELKQAYTILGHSEKVELFTYDDGHGISQPKREAVVAWFNSWLKKDTKSIPENKASIKTPAQLNVTTTGQASSAFYNEKSITDRNLFMFHSLQPVRESFGRQPKASVLSSVRKLSGINTDRSVTIEEKGTVEEKGIVFIKKIIRKQNEMPLPVLVVYPTGKPKQVIVWCGDEGKARSAASDTLRNLINDGYVVVLCDLRGIGETEDKPELNDPKYYNREYRNAMLALHNGRSLVGQRATDILSVIDMFKTDQRLAGLAIDIKASGITAIPALHAALFEEGVRQVYLSRAIRSYRQVLDNPVVRDWYSYIIADVLKQYDIPDLEKLIGVARIRY